MQLSNKPMVWQRSKCNKESAGTALHNHVNMSYVPTSCGIHARKTGGCFDSKGKPLVLLIQCLVYFYSLTILTIIKKICRSSSNSGLWFDSFKVSCMYN